jgi:hypothetical protein
VLDKKVALAWLSHPRRRQYDEIVFDPSGKEAAKAFNVWRGLATKPGPGTCPLIIQHIRDVWCGGDRGQFLYVLQWMGLLVQKPWIKPEVALVLRSREGVGKTIIVELLLSYFGAHGFTAASKDQVAGRFNAHLFDKVLVVLEEAFFAGDPAAVASMKALVTNATFGYEGKGTPSFSAPNHAHVISLTNAAWAVPAGQDARRWMVLDVSDARRGNHAYFMALAAEINSGGREAFLSFLLKLDISRFNPRALPQSAALRDQQAETLRRSDPVAAWLAGVLAEAAFAVKDGTVEWEGEIYSGSLQDAYGIAMAKARNAPIFDVAMKQVRKLLPPGSLTTVRKSSHGMRPRYYLLPDLDEARATFMAKTGVDPCAP